MMLVTGQGHFIPPAPIRALRALTRYRKTLVQERTAALNRLQKVLEAATLTLATAVLGASGRAMLAALVGGERDPAAVADLRGKLREKHVIASHILKEKGPYTDLSADYFDTLDTTRIERHHVHRLEQLGYTVTLSPTEAA